MKRILAVIGACLGLSACVVNDGYGYYDDYSGYDSRYYGSANSRLYYSDYYGYNRPYVNNNYYTNRYYSRDGRYDRNDRRYNRNDRDDRRYDRDNRRPNRVDRDDRRPNTARPSRDNRPIVNRPSTPRPDRNWDRDRSSSRPAGLTRHLGERETRRDSR